MLVSGLLGTFRVCWATPTIWRVGPREPLMPLGAMEGKTPLWSIPIAATVHLCPPAASPDWQRPPCRLRALPPLDLALAHPDIHPILPRSPASELSARPPGAALLVCSRLPTAGHGAQAWSPLPASLRLCIQFCPHTLTGHPAETQACLLAGEGLVQGLGCGEGAS